ncbi:uncharacterized protein LOC129233368 [Uloborus diversus]|uniref:uncharacterized protein LOC129233368 n=1 Tax=Uloborus diversus TaxID=327109 RepID=UPI002409B6F7|nr:uncharacterized protein LOC129233368 [Uloborus diversus]
MKEEIIFPWIASVSDRFYKTFASDYLLEDLQFLLMNIDTEVNKVLQKQSKDKTKSLFTVLINFYNHFCGKLKHQKDSFYLNAVCAKILSSLILIGLILSNGKTATKWIKQILCLIRMFPGNYETIYHSLLLITNLKKKHHACYSVILRQLLFSKFRDSFLDPETYMTVMLLCRRLKRMSKKQDELDVFSIISKIEPPPNIQDWLLEKVGNMHLKKSKLLSKHLVTSKLPVSTLEKIRKVILEKWCLKNSSQDAIIQKAEDELFIIDTGIISVTKGVSTNLKCKKKVASKTVATNSKSRKNDKRKTAVKFSEELPNNKKTIATTSRDIESYRVDLPKALRPLSCACDVLKQKNHKRKHKRKQLKNHQTYCSNCEELVITVKYDSDIESVRQAKKRKVEHKKPEVEDCHKNNLIAPEEGGTKTNASSSLRKTSVSNVLSVKKRKKLKRRHAVNKLSPISMMGEHNETDNSNNLQSSSQLCIETTSTNQQNEVLHSSNTSDFSEQKDMIKEIKNLDQDENIISTISKELPVTSNANFESINENKMQPSTQVSSNQLKLSSDEIATSKENVLESESAEKEFSFDNLSEKSNVESGSDLIELVSQDFDSHGIHAKKSATNSHSDEIDKELILTNDKKSNIKECEERLLKHNDKGCSLNFEKNIFPCEESSTHFNQSNIIIIKDQNCPVPGDEVSLSQDKVSLSGEHKNTNEMPCKKVVALDESKSINLKNVLNLKENVDLTENIENLEKITRDNDVLQKHDFEINHGKEEELCVSREDANANEMPDKKGINLEKIAEDYEATLAPDLEINHDKEKDSSLKKGRSELYSHSSECIPLLEENSEFYSHSVESKQLCNSTIENIKKERSTHSGQSKIVAIKDQSSAGSEEGNDPSAVQCRTVSKNVIPSSQNKICVSGEDTDVNEIPNKKERNIEKIAQDNKAILPPDLETNHDKEKDNFFAKGRAELYSHCSECIPLLEENPEFCSHSVESKRSGDATVENVKESSTQSNVVVEDLSSSLSKEENNPDVVHCRNDSGNAIQCSQNEICVSREDANAKEMLAKKVKNLERIIKDNEAILPADLEINHDKEKDISLAKRESDFHSQSTENITLLDDKSEFHSHSVESTIENIKKESSTHSGQSKIVAIKNQSSTISEEENNPSVVQCRNDSRDKIPSQNKIHVSRKDENSNEFPEKKDIVGVDSKCENVSNSKDIMKLSEDTGNLEKITKGNEVSQAHGHEIYHDKKEKTSLPRGKSEFHSHSTENNPIIEIKYEFCSRRSESRHLTDSTTGNNNKKSANHSRQSNVVAIKDQSSTVSEKENNLSVVQCRNDSENLIPCSKNETCVSSKDANVNEKPDKNEKILEKITQDKVDILPADLDTNHDNDTDIFPPKEKSKFHSQNAESSSIAEEKSEFHSHNSECKQSHDSIMKKVGQCEGDMKSPKNSTQHGNLKLIRKYICSPDGKDGTCLGLSSSDSEYMTLEELNESSEEFVFVESSDSVDEMEMSKSSICIGNAHKHSKRSSGSSSNLKRKGSNLSSDEQQCTHLQSEECFADEKQVNSVSFPDSVASKKYLSFAEVSKHEKGSVRKRTLPSVQTTCQSKSTIAEKNVHYTDNVSSKYNIEATTSKVGNKISVLVEFSKKKPNELNFGNAENLSVTSPKKQLCLESRTNENTSQSGKDIESETLPYTLRSAGSRTNNDDDELSNKKSPQVSFQVKVNMGKRCDVNESLSSSEMLSNASETHSNSEINRDIALHKNDSSASRAFSPLMEDSVSHELTSKHDKNSDSVCHAEVVHRPVTRSSQQEVEKASTDLNHNSDTSSINKKESNLSNMRVTNLFFENVRDETDSIHSQESYSSVGSNTIESDNSDSPGFAHLDRKKTLRSSSKKVSKEKSNLKPKIYPLRSKNLNNAESSSSNLQLGIDLSTLSLKSPSIKIPLLSMEDKIAADKSVTVSLEKVSEAGSRNIFNQGEIELPKRETRSSVLKPAKDDEKFEQKSANGSYNLRPKRNIIAPSRLKL